MKRLLAGLALALSLTGCADSQEAVPAESASLARPSSDAERNFLTITAAQWCDAQSGVYDDPAALDEAYALAPEYDGLSDAQVTELAARLTEDPAFTAELRALIATTCG